MGVGVGGGALLQGLVALFEGDEVEVNEDFADGLG